MPLSDHDRNNILQLAQEQFRFHGDGGCCGAAALAINEVLFDNKAEIVMAVNQVLLDRDRSFVGHVGVLDKKGTIWDFRTTYTGAEGQDDFMEWGMVGPDNPDYNLTEQEAESAEIYVFDSLEEAQEVVCKSAICPHGVDLASILRTAMAYYFRSRP
jgi:hypothetical protein